MAYKTVSYGLTHEQKLNECSPGFSANPSPPNNMTTLMKERQTELWANNKVPYFASYAPNGVSIYEWQKPIGWKRREWTVDGREKGCMHRPPSPDTFESIRFKFTEQELTETQRRRANEASSRRTTQQIAKTH